MGISSTGIRLACALAVAAAACGVGGIDASDVSPISNDDAYATLSYLWAGARSAIEREREPSAGSFNLPLSYQFPCARGGQGAVQGTLSGTKTPTGTGSGTLAMTGTLASCGFDQTTVNTISASGLTINGSINIANDTWGAISVRMVAPTVVINGVSCPGGVDVTITGTAPSSQPVSTGTVCGRTGAVQLP